MRKWRPGILVALILLTGIVFGAFKSTNSGESTRPTPLVADAAAVVSIASASPIDPFAHKSFAAGELVPWHLPFRDVAPSQRIQLLAGPVLIALVLLSLGARVVRSLAPHYHRIWGSDRPVYFTPGRHRWLK